MKKIIALSVAILLAMPMTILAAENMDGKKVHRLKGSDNVVQKTIQLTGEYTEIDASRGVKVEIEERPGNEVIIWANDNVMPYVEFEIEDGELEITIDDDVNSLSNVTVIVSLPNNNNITKIEASSAAKVQVKPELNVKTFKADASSAAEINFARANVESFAIDGSSSGAIKGVIKADNGYLEATSAADVDVTILAMRCTAKASSGAEIILAGEVGTLYAEASSAGDVVADGCLVLEMANAKASSGASIKVNSAKKLIAKASSGGSIRYKGEGSVVPDVSSGGSIKRM